MYLLLLMRLIAPQYALAIAIAWAIASLVVSRRVWRWSMWYLRKETEQWN